MDGHVGLQRIYVFEQMRLDPVSRSVSRDGQPVHLPARLFDTLHHMVRHSDRLVERTELLQTIWPGRTVEDGNVDRAISSLRAALKASGAPGTLIVTVTGRGYRLGATVSIETPPPAAMTASPAPPMPPSIDPPARWRPARWTAGIASAGAAMLGAALWLALPGSHTGPGPDGLAGAPPGSVAVLPFTNLSGEPAQDIFSDGVSEELINALGRVPGLHVAAGLSSFLFKGRQVTIADIARQLRVVTILEGSVRRDGARVLMTAQLIDAATGYQVWAQRYDRDQSALPSMEGEIAETVLGSLKIAPIAAASLTPGGTTDASAFDAYLAGMAVLAKTNDSTSQKAVDAFSAAIARDPHYALAYARRAQALAYRSATGASDDLAGRKTTMALALSDAEQSMALAPDLGAAHAALALVLRFSLKDFARAGSEYARAVQLSPGDATILMSDAFFELGLGHFEAAIKTAQKAAALDPLTPRTYRRLSELLAGAGRFDDALTALRRAQTLAPDPSGLDPLYLSFIQTESGDAAGAARTCAAGQDYHALSCLAWAYQKLGRFGEAEAALRELHALVQGDGAYLYARIAAQWGKPDEAIRWLQTAYDDQDAGLTAIRVDSFLAPLRGTPAFKQIEAKLGFPSN